MDFHLKESVLLCELESGYDFHGIGGLLNYIAVLIAVVMHFPHFYIMTGWNVFAGIA